MSCLWNTPPFFFCQCLRFLNPGHWVPTSLSVFNLMKFEHPTSLTKRSEMSGFLFYVAFRTQGRELLSCVFTRSQELKWQFSGVTDWVNLKCSHHKTICINSSATLTHCCPVGKILVLPRTNTSTSQHAGVCPLVSQNRVLNCYAFPANAGIQGHPQILSQDLNPQWRYTMSVPSDKGRLSPQSHALHSSKSGRCFLGYSRTRQCKWA